VHDDKLALPRGTLHDIDKLVSKAGGKVEIIDRRPTPATPDLSFIGTLTAIQNAAVDAMLGHEDGVLVAHPGAGKTVMACAAISRRSTLTLILVHRRKLNKHAISTEEKDHKEDVCASIQQTASQEPAENIQI
jgi:superfamily II DNA or RNA helicase